MKITDEMQIYHILQNLNSLEISYMEYSREPKNFVKYETYIEYFDNYVIRSHNLARFYFPYSFTPDMVIPKYVTDLEEITDSANILTGYDFSVAKQFNFPNPIRHKCNYYTVIYLMEGSGSLELDTESFSLNPGDFYIVPPEVYYALFTEPESICVCLNLRHSYVSAEYKSIFLEDAAITAFITKTLESGHAMTYLAVHTSNQEPLRNLVLTLFAEYVNRDKYSNSVMKNYLSLLFAMMLRDPHVQIDSSVKVSRTDRQYQEILDYLKQNYRTADLTSAAENIHFSKQYVCRIIKEKTGDTFNTLLMNIRLDMAQQYLADTDSTLENIAYLCGFTAASHLSKVFKLRNGVTPSAWRKEHQG